MGECILTRKKKIVKKRLYLYRNGEEFEEITGGWIEGHSYGIGDQKKEDDHLYLESSPSSLNMRSYVTNKKVNFNGFKRVFVEWENTGTDKIDNLSYINILNEKDSEHYQGIVAVRSETKRFSKKITKINVSDINSDHYLRIYAYYNTHEGDESSRIKVYRVWCE